MKTIFLLPAMMLLATVLHAQEEFNGAFGSWANLKTRFGAKGNGSYNDTRSFQKALDELGDTHAAGPAFYVLYLPAGTYCISTTLVLKGKMGVSIIGENPATTTIKWIGPDADTMLWANGSAYFKIARLTWDANNAKEIEAIGIHWKYRWNDGKSQSYAALNIEISDNVFAGQCKFGISGGTGPEGTNNNDSEIAIKRCLFQNCTGAGILTTGYNALDYWIWDCRFINCNIGINSRYGNFHAYRSYFENSGQADVTNTNGYYKSLRGCYSERSRGFIVDSGAGYNPFKRIYQGNTVIAPRGIPIQFYYLGKMMFLDNVFDKSIDTNNTAFAHSSSTVISLDNIYRNKTPVKFFNPYATFRQFGDSYNAKMTSTGNAFRQQQDKTPPFIKRQIFEVPAGAGDASIQQIVTAAAKLTGKRPVVHFSPGVYKISKPILVPAGADIQFTGDGCLSVTILMPAANFPPGNAILKIMGPSAVSIRELQIGNFTNGKTSIDGIQFENIDQAGATAFIDQLYAVGSSSVRAEGLDNLYIQKDNSFFADNDFISGGPLVQAGKGTAGLYGFGGQFAGIIVQKNARAVLKDCWWEGSERVPLNLSGSGSITIDGAMIAPNHADSNTTISVKKFTGKISLLNMYIQGGLDIESNNPGLKIMLMNAHFYHTMSPLKFLSNQNTFQGLFTGITTQCFTAGDKKCDQIVEVSEGNSLVKNTGAFIPELLEDDRKALPRKFEKRDPSSSNIFISRVSVGDMKNAVKFSK